MADKASAVSANRPASRAGNKAKPQATRRGNTQKAKPSKMNAGQKAKSGNFSRTAGTAKKKSPAKVNSDTKVKKTQKPQKELATRSLGNIDNKPSVNINKVDKVAKTDKAEAPKKTKDFFVKPGINEINTNNDKLNLKLDESFTNPLVNGLPPAVFITGDNNNLSLPKSSKAAPVQTFLHGDGNKIKTQEQAFNPIGVSGGNNNHIQYGSNQEQALVAVQKNQNTGLGGSGNFFDARASNANGTASFAGFDSNGIEEDDWQDYNVNSAGDTITIVNQVTGEKNIFEGFNNFVFGKSPWQYLHNDPNVGSGWINTQTIEFNKNKIS